MERRPSSPCHTFTCTSSRGGRTTGRGSTGRKSQGTGKRSWAPRTVSAPCSDSHGRGKSRKARVMSERKIRLVVAKPGLDGHDRGAKIVARALRDAGFEVIYTGLHQTPEQIVETAIQEDADAVGLSLLSGAHMTLFPEVIELLKQRGIGDVLVFGGGIIPDADIPKLKELGVGEIFTPGASLGSISGWLEAALDGAESDRAETDA